MARQIARSCFGLFVVLLAGALATPPLPGDSEHPLSDDDLLTLVGGSYYDGFCTAVEGCASGASCKTIDRSDSGCQGPEDINDTCTDVPIQVIGEHPEHCPAATPEQVADCHATSTNPLVKLKCKRTWDCICKLQPDGKYYCHALNVDYDVTGDVKLSNCDGTEATEEWFDDD